MPDKTFVAGLFFKKPHEKAPSFVIGSLSAKREELIAFLNLRTDEWVNMSIKESKGGKPYIEIDDWQPNQVKSEPKVDPVIGDDGGEAPF